MAPVGAEPSIAASIWWARGNFLLAKCFCTELLPMTASTLSPRAEMVFQRHVPPTQAPVLKNPASELMTRLAFIAQPSAEPQRSTTHRDARKIWETVKPLQSAVKPETTATPAKGPGHNVEAVLRPLRGRRTRNLHPSPTKI